MICNPEGLILILLVAAAMNESWKIQVLSFHVDIFSEIKPNTHVYGCCLPNMFFTVKKVQTNEITGIYLVCFLLYKLHMTSSQSTIFEEFGSKS